MDRHEIVAKFFKSRARCKPATLDFYAWCLSKIPEGALPSTTEEIEEVLAAPGLGPVSRVDLWRGLRTFYNWAERRHQAINPLWDIKKPRIPRIIPKYLREEQVDQVWKATRDRRETTAIATILDTGLRVGELVSLKRSHIMQSTLLVEGKVGERQVPVSPEVREMLLSLTKGEAIWTGLKGPLTVWGMKQLITDILRRGGVPRGGAHTLRHTFAVQYLKNGGEIFSLQRILGHSNITTTRIYLNLLDEDVQEQHRRFTPARRVLALPRSTEDQGVQLSLFDTPVHQSGKQASLALA